MINHLDSFKMKNMKKLLVIIFVFSIQFINAQDKDLVRAKRFFDKTFYSEAIILYEKLAEEKPSQEVIKNLADSYYYKNELHELENVSAIGNRFDIKNLAINTPNSEFGAVKYKSNLVFAGVKLKPGLFDKKFKWDNETYLNLVSIPLTEINTPEANV